MNTNSGTLKPCPFCGGEARIGKEPYKAWGGDTREKTQIFCGNCFAMVDVLASDRDFEGQLAISAATEKWNKRVSNISRRYTRPEFHAVED